MSGVDDVSMLDIKKIRAIWIEKEEKKIEEKRKYPHFDPIIKLDDEKKALIFSPEYIAGYSFSPLIKSSKEERRRKRMDDSGLREFHLKERPIFYASHLDALLYSWYGHLLNEHYGNFLVSEGLSECVLAYRSLGKGTPEFVKEVCEYIREQQTCVALCFDISSFFDTISHQVLKSKWEEIISTRSGSARLPDDHFRIFESITQSRYIVKEEIEKKYFHGKKIPSKHGKYIPNGSFLDFILKKHKELKKYRERCLYKNTVNRGIPQGLPISGTLANISMLDFDRAINNFVKRHSGIYRRYSDDIIVVIAAEAEMEAEASIRKELDALCLTVSEKKTEIIRFSYENEDPLICRNRSGSPSRLQYLGIEFDGKNYFLRSQSISKFYRKIKRTISTAFYKKRKLGGKILRYRELYKKYISNADRENFDSYSQRAHKTLSPNSRIHTQINSHKIKRIIKAEIAKLRSGYAP